MSTTTIIQQIAHNQALYAEFNTILQTLVIENALYGHSRIKPLVQKIYQLTTTVYDTLQEDQIVLDKSMLLEYILTRVGLDVNVAKRVYPAA